MDITADIAKSQQKLANAREMLMDEKIDPDDFRIMKKDSEEKIKRLELSLSELTRQKSNFLSVDRMIAKAVEALSSLHRLYLDGDVHLKRQVLGSIFREKLRFDGKKYRTTRLNEAAGLIYQINRNLRENINGKDAKLSLLSREVVPTRIELYSQIADFQYYSSE